MACHSPSVLAGLLAIGVQGVRSRDVRTCTYEHRIAGMSRIPYAVSRMHPEAER